MGYNYGLERKKFCENWDRLRQDYLNAGMNETDIQQLYGHDLAEFKGERIFITHTQPLESSRFPNSDVAGEDQNPLLNRQLKHLSVCQPNISTWGRNAWIEDLDTPELAQRVKSLAPADLELLTYLVADDLSRAEIARKLHVSRANITKRINRIKNILIKTDC